MMMRITTLLTTAVLSLALAACSANSYLSLIGLGANNDIENISVETAPNANRNMPVALDLLFVRDESVAELLTGLSGPEWFARKQELLIRYDRKLSLASFEIVPLTIVDSLRLPEDYQHANKVLLFANYLGSDGQYVAELGHYRQLKIRLDREAYQLLEMDKG